MPLDDNEDVKLSGKGIVPVYEVALRHNELPHRPLPSLVSWPSWLRWSIVYKTRPTFGASYTAQFPG